MSECDAHANTCPECGAPAPLDATCLANFHTLLALEWEIPGGPGELAHFFAVAAYVVQHPGSMGYTKASVNGLVGAMRDVLDGHASIAEIRTQVRGHVALAERVTRRKGDAVPQNEVGVWPTVVTDVIAGGPEGYRQRVKHWARSAIETLDSIRG